MCVRLRPVEAVVVITAAKEEVRRCSIWDVQSVEKGGLGWRIRLSSHRTLIQETVVQH